jgi:hypothetical protein
MLIFGTDIKLFCSEDLIEFTTNGPTGEMNVKIDTNDLDEFSIDMGTKFDFCYNLNYLNKMCLTKNLSDKIYFSLSKECPLKIKYDLEDTNININFYKHVITIFQKYLYISNSGSISLEYCHTNSFIRYFN